MPNGLTDTDRGYAAALGSLRAIAKGAHVVVGVRGQKGAARVDGDKSPLTLVEVATVNEYGSEDGHVPERSFLRSTFDAQKTEIGRAMAAGLDKIILGRGTTDDLLGRVGLKLAGDVVQTINTGVPPSNAPATIARKGSSHTLIDEGRLRQSIDHEVRRGRGR